MSRLNPFCPSRNTGTACTCPRSLRPIRQGIRDGERITIIKAQDGQNVIVSSESWERLRRLGYSPNVRAYFQRIEECWAVQIDIPHPPRRKTTRVSVNLARLLMVIHEVAAGQDPRRVRAGVRNRDALDLRDSNLRWTRAGKNMVATTLAVDDVKRRWRIAASGLCPNSVLSAQRKTRKAKAAS